MVVFVWGERGGAAVGIAMIGIALLVLAIAAHGANVTITYEDIIDSHVYRWSPTTNYGGSTLLAVDGHRNSMMHFDLSGVSGTIDSARLTLNIHGNIGGQYIYIAPLSRGFVESEVSWDSAQSGIVWSIAGGDFDSCSSDWCDTSTATEAEYDSDIYIYSGDGGGLVEIIQDWIDNANYGLFIQASGGNTINSTEASVETRRPSLFIAYTPGTAGIKPVSRRRELLSGAVGPIRDALFTAGCACWPCSIMIWRDIL